MIINKNLLEKIAISIEKMRTVQFVEDNTGFLFDEPRIFSYTAKLNLNSPFFTASKKIIIQNPTASGMSFTSRKVALLKCLMEIIERACLISSDTIFIQSTFRKFAQKGIPVLNPHLYLNRINTDNISIHWIQGRELTENRNCMVPAQLFYLRFPSKNSEPVMTTSISTGAACGLTHETTLLRAIYEVVERDSFMSIYLCKIKPPKVNPSSLRKIRDLIEKFNQYNLELKIFNITTDFQIPCFMSLVIDK